MIMEKNKIREVYKKEIKPLIRPFVILFILAFFAVNWENAIWIFNKEALMQSISDRTRLLSENLESEIQIPQPSQEAPTSESPDTGLREGQEAVALEALIPEKVSLVIPKMALEKDVIFPKTHDQKEISDALMAKVMHYPGSAMPGKEGNMVLLAHSAPISWPPSYRVFNKLDQLEAGDRLYIYFGKEIFTYEVAKRYLIAPGAELPLPRPGTKYVFLLTCWPPNSGAQRMVAEGFLVE